MIWSCAGVVHGVHIVGASARARPARSVGPRGAAGHVVPRGQASLRSTVHGRARSTHRLDTISCKFSSWTMSSLRGFILRLHPDPSKRTLFAIEKCLSIIRPQPSHSSNKYAIHLYKLHYLLCVFLIKDEFLISIKLYVELLVIEYYRPFKAMLATNLF